MDSKNFILFQYDAVLLYKDALTNDEVEASFEKLVKVKHFDGAKKISKDDDGAEVTLTSADNKFVLSYSSKSELFVSFTNRSLSVDVTSEIEVVNSLLLEANATIGGGTISMVRSRQTMFSPKSADKKHLTATVINKDYLSDLDNLEVDFTFDEPDVARKPVDSWVRLSYQHTTEMHKVIESLNKESILDKLIVLYVDVGYYEFPTPNQAAKFLDTKVDYQTSFRILERFGYGKR